MLNKNPKTSVAKLKKLADKHWSIYIRMRDSDKYGICECISCSVRKPYKEMQNGHFVSRSSSSLRFDDENCNGQCVSCNMFKQGNQYAYAKALDLKYGDGTADRLHDRRFETHKFSIGELEDIISEAKANIKEMELAWQL